ncbi:MAG: hypothetical protein LBT59_11330 [Clostridiales bacterium]|jgi:hypothetical protein|nr:hypothetical protein [Clostridiales bacterium]
MDKDAYSLFCHAAEVCKLKSLPSAWQMETLEDILREVEKEAKTGRCRLVEELGDKNLGLYAAKSVVEFCLGTSGKSLNECARTYMYPFQPLSEQDFLYVKTELAKVSDRLGTTGKKREGLPHSSTVEDRLITEKLERMESIDSECEEKLALVEKLKAEAQLLETEIGKLEGKKADIEASVKLEEEKKEKRVAELEAENKEKIEKMVSGFNARKALLEKEQAELEKKAALSKEAFEKEQSRISEDLKKRTVELDEALKKRKAEIEKILESKSAMEKKGYQENLNALKRINAHMLKEIEDSYLESAKKAAKEHGQAMIGIAKDYEEKALELSKSLSAISTLEEKVETLTRTIEELTAKSALLAEAELVEDEKLEEQEPESDQESETETEDNVETEKPKEEAGPEGRKSEPFESNSVDEKLEGLATSFKHVFNRLANFEAALAQREFGLLMDSFAFYQRAVKRFRNGMDEKLIRALGSFETRFFEGMSRVGFNKDSPAPGDPFDPEIHDVDEDYDPKGSYVIEEVRSDGFSVNGVIVKQPNVKISAHPKNN